MEYQEIKQKVLEDVDVSTKKAKKKKTLKSILQTLLEFIVIIVVIFVAFRLVIGMSYVDGNSMYPTLHNKELVLYNRLASKNYVKGDVIAIERPGNVMYVKRVVAVAGDTVNMEDGKLYVNGKLQKEEEIYGQTFASKDGISFPVTVREKEVFVLGDNREVSDDSRSFGPIKTADTEGKLIYYIGSLE